MFKAVKKDDSVVLQITQHECSLMCLFPAFERLKSPALGVFSHISNWILIIILLMSSRLIFSKFVKTEFSVFASDRQSTVVVFLTLM